MNYWKGLAVAVAMDLVWIMGSPILAPNATAPISPEAVRVVPVEPRVRAVAREVDQLVSVSAQLDSLMMYLREHPEDVDAIEKVADVYAHNGWWNDAIGPLARAVQLDPERWSLWSALDRAVENAGMATISDEDLTMRAQGFVEAIEMWGHGC